MEEEIQTIEEDVLTLGVTSVNGLTGDVPLKTVNGQEVTGEGDIEISGGEGDVKTVNNIAPDEEGNVGLSAADVGAATAEDVSTAVATETAARELADSTLQNAINGKQAALTETQLAAVNSGIDSTKVGQIATNTTNIGTNTGDIATINGKIPAQASSSNQLADKGFVNSSIQTQTAHFRGNWATWNDVPTDGTLYPVDDDGHTTPTSNDYMVVQDASGYPVGSGEPALAGTWRFKYSGTWSTDGKNGWLPEYQVNETPLTSDQLAALNSGITAEAVTKLGGIEAGAEVNDIDSISVNGTAVTPDANKNVDLTIDAGIKTLTTADYNWPTTGTKTAVALWLLPSGFYRGDSSSVVFKATESNNTFSDDVVYVSSSFSSPARKEILVFHGHVMDNAPVYAYLYQTRISDGGSLGMMVLKTPVNTLISNDVNAPLGASQGKILNDKIEGRLKTNAGAPTTSTVGTKGQLLEDTTNGNLYICTNSASPYAWKQIDKDEILTNAGAPTTSTAGTLGQLLTDTTNAKLYQLTAIDTTDPQNPSYTWSEIGGGSGPTVVQTTGTSTTDVMSQNAVTGMVYADPTTKRKVKLGAAEFAGGDESFVFGTGAQAGNYSIALGRGAKASYENSVAFPGSNASAIGVVAFDTVSFGSSKGYNSSNYRLLTGVYDGQSAHDAATKGQLDSIAIKGAGAPTTSTTGAVGQLYEDTTNGKLYICTAIVPGTDPDPDTYTWTEVGAGGDESPFYLVTFTGAYSSSNYSDKTVDEIKAAFDAGKIPLFYFKDDTWGRFYAVSGNTSNNNWKFFQTLIVVGQARGANLPAFAHVTVDYNSTQNKYVYKYLPTNDIVDNLTSTETRQPLSANQGKVLNTRLGGLTFVSISQTDYDNLSTYDPNTLYVITGA